MYVQVRSHLQKEGGVCVVAEGLRAAPAGSAAVEMSPLSGWTTSDPWAGSERETSGKTGVVRISGFIPIQERLHESSL